MDSNILEYGIGGLLAITILKTVLPYVKPAKNSGLAKEVCDILRPILDRQTDILNKMNERDIIVSTQMSAQQEYLKDVRNYAQNTSNAVDAIHKRMDRSNG